MAATHGARPRGARTKRGGAAARHDSGVYLLLLEVSRDVEVRVGALGAQRVPAGRYVYVGSARRGLRARADRHLRRDKPVRWHIDHLTTHPAVRTLGAVLAAGPADECRLSKAVGRRGRATAPIPGFGASDCRRRCRAHLWRLETPG